MVQPPCLIKLAPCRTLLDVLCLSPHQRRSVRCWLQEPALLVAGLVSKQEGPEQAWNFLCLAPMKSFTSLVAGQALLQLHPALAVAYCPVSLLWASGSLRCWEGGVHPGPSLGAGGALTTLRTLGETQQAKGGGLVGVRGEKLTQMGRVEVWG